jgi:hypothetical protein
MNFTGALGGFGHCSLNGWEVVLGIKVVVANPRAVRHFACAFDALRRLRSVIRRTTYAPPFGASLQASVGDEENIIRLGERPPPNAKEIRRDDDLARPRRRAPSLAASAD